MMTKEALCAVKKKALYIAKHITVEPAYFMFAISQGLYLIVSAELYISKVCKVNLAFGEEICDNIQQHKDQQAEVQQFASSLKIYNNVLQSIPMVIFSMFAGPWSDTNGRKFLIVSSLFGFILNNGVFMINTYWFYELKAEYLLFECLQDCTGGFAAFFFAVNAYMADITSEENRTKRMAFLFGLWPLGFNIGRALGGVVKTELGFMYNFGLGMFLSTSAMVYAIVFVKDSLAIQQEKKRKAMQGKNNNNGEKGDKKEEEEEAPVRTSVNLRTLFSIENVKDGFRALWVKRDNNMRLYLLLIIGCMEMEMFVNTGKWSLDYLYLRRTLSFTMMDYTRYTTIVGCIAMVSQYLVIPVLAERFKFRDSTIVMLDISGCFVQALIMAFTNSEYWLYLGAVIAMLDFSSNTMLRCMITKCVRSDEIGKVMAIATAIQAFIPIVSGPAFGSLYKATLTIFPQTYLVVIAVLLSSDFCVLLFIDRGLKRRAERAAAASNKELEGNGGGKETIVAAAGMEAAISC